MLRVAGNDENIKNFIKELVSNWSDSEKIRRNSSSCRAKFS